MDIKSAVSDFAPVSGWKQWVGLALIIIVTIALARRFGVQQKVEKTVGA